MALTFSITLLVAAVCALFVGSLLPDDYALWGILTAGTLVLGSFAVLIGALIGMRRRR